MSWIDAFFVTTGVAPIVVQNGAVSITPATEAAAGSMSATDKAKLDGIPSPTTGQATTTDGTTVTTLVTSAALPLGKSWISILVEGVIQGSDHAIVFELRTLVRNAGGTVTVTTGGTTESNFSAVVKVDETSATLGATNLGFSPGASTIALTVVGAVSTTIKWSATLSAQPLPI